LLSQPFYGRRALLPGRARAALVSSRCFAFRTGLPVGDFHVLGLIGGINGFLANPAGTTARPRRHL